MLSHQTFNHTISSLLDAFMLHRARFQLLAFCLGSWCGPALALFALTANASADEPRLKIGMVAGVTGPLASQATAVYRGAKMALAHSGASAPELILEDDGFMVKNAVPSFTKLADQHNVSGVIVFGSGQSLAISPVASKRRIPIIGLAMSDKLAVGTPFVFRLMVPARAQGASLASEVTRRGYKRVAIFTTLIEAMTSVRDAFLPLAANIEIVANEEINPGDPEIRQSVARLRSARPDAVLVLSVSPALAVVARQLRSQGWKGDFFGSLNIYTPSEIETAQGALEGSWFVGVDDSRTRILREEYIRTFNEQPLMETWMAYDAVMLMIPAIRSADPNLALQSATNVAGLLGPYTITPEHDIQIPAAINVVEGLSYHSGGTPASE